MPSCTENDLKIFFNEMKSYDKIFYKWLSPNDYLWAENKNIHQSGVLIPRKYISFFGVANIPLTNKTFELDIYWLLNGKKHTRQEVKYTRTSCSKLKYFCKGNRKDRPEIHLTNVYSPYFENLRYGPLLIMGHIPNNDSFIYNTIIIDEDYLIEILHNKIDIPEGSLWGTLSVIESSVSMDFDLSENIFDILKHKAEKLYSQHKKIPSTEITSSSVWEIFQHKESLLKGEFACPGLSISKNPMETSLRNSPGNLTRWALTKIEYQLIKYLEELHYPLIITEKIKNRITLYPSDWSDLKMAIGNSLNEIIEIAKSITNSRRSRAGYSFEWHIYNLLKYLNVNVERQSGDNRIDFKISLKNKIINLSAKTSTRERWKQIYSGSYFITLERRIPSAKIMEIKERDIKIIVPEKDMEDFSYYKNDSYIMTFKDFLYGELAK